MLCQRRLAGRQFPESQILHHLQRAQGRPFAEHAACASVSVLPRFWLGSDSVLVWVWLGSAGLWLRLGMVLA